MAQVLSPLIQAAPPRGRRLYFTFPSAPDPLFKGSKAPFLTLRVATLSGAPCQAPLENPVLKGLQKPETYRDNKLFAMISFTSVFSARSGAVWRQDHQSEEAKIPQPLSSAKTETKN